jgi:hypothetical protein
MFIPPVALVSADTAAEIPAHRSCETRVGTALGGGHAIDEVCQRDIASIKLGQRIGPE